MKHDMGPMGGLRVLECAMNFAGPWAGAILSDYGADVIKVEDPGAGDPSRVWPPEKDGVSLGFLRVNRGKRSLGLDLRTESGRRLLLRLIETVDILIMAFRPSTVEAWGLGYEQLSKLNPRLVYVSISGYGLTGPYRDRPGYGSTADAVSGFSHIVGFPDQAPTAAHFGLADLITGTSAAMAASMAIYARERTNRGDLVDAALYEPLMCLVGDIILMYSTTGVIRERTGNKSGITSPGGVFKAKDGKWVTISGSGQRPVARLFEAMGRPEAIRDPRFSTNAARLANDEELNEWIAGWVRSRTRDEVLATLLGNNVVCGPVNTAADIVVDPHFVERTIVKGHSDMVGDAMYPGRMVRLGSLEKLAFADAPRVGQHTDEVLRELLNESADSIAAMRTQGVVG